MTGLELKNASFGYPGTPAIVNATGTFDRGVLAILGPNGSGKSTLLAGLLGARQLRSGTATLDGESLTSLPPRDRASRVAYIAQRPAAAPGYTANEYISLGRAMLARNPSAIHAAIERTGITPLLDSPVHTLSVGQLQRVCIARALAQLNPGENSSQTKLLLADEPISALDPSQANLVLRTIHELTRDHPVIAAVVLHDPAAAKASADHALLLSSDHAPARIEPAEHAITPARLQALYDAPFQVDALGLPRPVYPLAESVSTKPHPPTPG